MSKHRTDALNKIIEDLLNFNINFTTYYSDLEPMASYDTGLTAKIECLRGFCVMQDWSELISQIDSYLPVSGNAQVVLEYIQNFIIPEVKHLVETSSTKRRSSMTWFWKFIHPRISKIAKPRFSFGFYGDAVEASFKEINDIIKQIVINNGGPELDGASLMTRAFSLQNPIIKLTDLKDESARNIQQGYMQIMAGAMIGIRNPKAHANLNPDKLKTMHLISLASLLMFKIDERFEPI